MDDGTYWVHVIVNRKQALPDFDGLYAAFGEVVDSRVDWHDRGQQNIPHLPDQAHLTQLAVRIRPVRP
ncbi:MAG: hypothetical protein INR68_18945 [Methylobacterium mesophilicum]|nr:hypothetical protein [Methylobacterium mesophilicum]